MFFAVLVIKSPVEIVAISRGVYSNKQGSFFIHGVILNRELYNEELILNCEASSHTIYRTYEVAKWTFYNAPIATSKVACTCRPCENHQALP